MILGFVPRKYGLGDSSEADLQHMLVVVCLHQHGAKKSWARFFSKLGKTFSRDGQNFFPGWAKLFSKLGKIFLSFNF